MPRLRSSMDSTLAKAGETVSQLQGVRDRLAEVRDRPLQAHVTANTTVNIDGRRAAAVTTEKSIVAGGRFSEIR
jgi:hypothetical protein